jgi:hypothetical protein
MMFLFKKKRKRKKRERKVIEVDKLAEGKVEGERKSLTSSICH